MDDFRVVSYPAKKPRVWQMLCKTGSELALPINQNHISLFECLSLTPALSRWERENHIQRV